MNCLHFLESEQIKWVFVIKNIEFVGDFSRVILSSKNEGMLVWLVDPETFYTLIGSKDVGERNWLVNFYSGRCTLLGQVKSS